MLQKTEHVLMYHLLKMFSAKIKYYFSTPASLFSPHLLAPNSSTCFICALGFQAGYLSMDQNHCNRHYLLLYASTSLLCLHPFKALVLLF